MSTNIKRTDAQRSAVLSLLGVKLPKDVEGLQSALREAEACYIGILTARIEAQSVLFTERLRYRMPKDKDYTDWDRKLMLDANTSELQAEYEMFAGLEKALGQRMAVIQTLLTP